MDRKDEPSSSRSLSFKESKNRNVWAHRLVSVAYPKSPAPGHMPSLL